MLATILFWTIGFVIFTACLTAYFYRCYKRAYASFGPLLVGSFKSWLLGELPVHAVLIIMYIGWFFMFVLLIMLFIKEAVHHD